jgi:hypothetical protein
MCSAVRELLADARMKACDWLVGWMLTCFQKYSVSQPEASPPSFYYDNKDGPAPDNQEVPVFALFDRSSSLC